jgi:hypothetical protein
MSATASAAWSVESATVSAVSSVESATVSADCSAASSGDDRRNACVGGRAPFRVVAAGVAGAAASR